MIRTLWNRAQAWRDEVLGETDMDERGDVPGWVLVTLMTAGLVVAIWTLAGPALADLFEQALSRVSGF
ncbi:MAG: hypothetical protein J0I43_01605 [Microbacterium sp.]|uniref:hypothetical protein n=1 Tax=Microbacterium sp. TaxID=51671 RepID=UPI001AC6CEA0|nr:hypothetical protein [Microbacterium sp.]MBN9176055.1 hypothetical protein [Microbacterium sp.]